MTYSPSSPVFAKSRITAAQFAAFLRSKRSPAAVEASAIYAVLGSVDPAVALGQFGAESSFGTAGYAKITRNWGNIAMATPGTPRLLRAARIASHWTRAFGATGYSPGNGYTYAKFATWRNGARAYTALMNTYKLRGWAPSISAMCRKWLGGIGTGYIANIVRIANAVTGTVAPPIVVPPAPPPVVVPPQPAIRPISTTPEHIAAKQPDPFQFGTIWTAGWELDTSAWVAAGKAGPTYLLIHGGPIHADNLGGMDNLAGWLASKGARAVALRYPTLNVTWAQATQPIRDAIAKYKPTAIVAHSLGGYFGGILAYQAGLPLVLIAADDAPNDNYRIPLGGPLARDEMKRATNRVTVVTGSADHVATVAENQALVADLAASGHPGKWLVIDGADHNNILSDVGTIAAVLG